MQSVDCEILVLGTEPVGLSLALAAARRGKSVIIPNNDPRPDGQVWYDGPQVPPPRYTRRLRQAIAEHPNITLSSDARLVTRPTPHSVAFETANNCGEIRWQQLISYYGTRKLSLPLPGWTLPNVTGAGNPQT